MFHKTKAAKPAFGVAILLTISMLLSAFCFLIQPNIVHSTVKGASMEPTLKNNQHLIAVAHSNIHHGDIVIAQSDVFGCNIVKRVIAIPGDTISIKDNVVFLNGTPLDEPYITEEQFSADMHPLSLEENMYFLMGDNRNHSSDSRMVGPLKRDEILYVIPLQYQAELIVIYLLILCLLAIAVLHVSTWGAKLFTVLYYMGKNRGSADRCVSNT